ncbi:lipopolysaccharide biosynthesis protein [Puia dinghuensis]|nr:polysaccharide biosynthesis C-terminal domain-containing protein [Puia dinghuensis]
MSTIRRQSIISSGVVYIGFALGALNNLLFAKWLPPDENGLVIGMFVAIGNIMYPIATFGMPSFINKFYPYYKANLKDRDDDMMSVALLLTLGAFLLVIAAGLVFQPLVIRKFGNNSALLVHYYYWIFPFGLGLSLLYVLEAFGWQLKRSILTNFLRELLWRALNTVLIVLLFLGVLRSHDAFIKLYSLNYLWVAGILLVFLLRKKELHFVFRISRVTKKFLPKVKSLILLAWSAGIILNLSMYFAQPVIGAVVAGGLSAVAVFTIGQFIASLVMAPQRAVAAAAIGPLSQAWRDGDHQRISRIYHRSAINQLIFAIGIFILIAINFRDAIMFFGLKPEYLAAETVFLIIGLNRVIDMGTGLNTQIIGTSIHWRLDFWTGMILVSLTIPLNYILAKRYGIIGPAIADLITFGLYNTIRCLFLYRKYQMNPFDRRTLIALLLGIALYYGCRLLFGGYSGFGWMVLRSVVFSALYGGSILLFRLSDDVIPVWNTVKKRLGLRSAPTR